MYWQVFTYYKDVCKVPGGVLGFVEQNDESQTKTACNNQENPQAEHCHDFCLLLPRHGQLEYEWEWQGEYDQVVENCNGCIGCGQCTDIDACVRNSIPCIVPALPIIIDWQALQKLTNYENETIQDYQKYEIQRESLQSSAGEDAAKHGQQHDFGYRRQAEV